MAPPSGDAAPVKKRRSFFSSVLNITPNLPAATASRAPIITSSEVLAALSAPEEVIAVKRREPKVKHAETSTPTSTHGTPGTPTPAESASATTTIPSGQRRALRVKPSPLVSVPKDSPPLTPTTTGVNGQATATDSGKAGRSLRARPSIQYTELEEEETTVKAPLSPPLTASAGRVVRPKRHSHSGITATSTSTLISIPATASASGSGSGRGRHAAKNGGVAHAPLLRTPTMASRRGYKPPPETSANGLANTTGKRGGKNAQHAQSVNERLSQMMLANIRATIGGREEPSPVRSKGATASPRVNKTKSTPSTTRMPIKYRKAQTTMGMTARQKAKVKAEKGRNLRGKGKRVVGKQKADDFDDIMDDDKDEGFEDLTSSDDDGPAMGKGRGRAARTNGRYTRDEKGKGTARDPEPKESRDKRAQRPDEGGKATAKSASTSTSALATSKGKQYMNAGFYCQDANAKSPFKLVNKILGTKKNGTKRTAAATSAGTSGLSFPPLPYDHGYEHFFGREHDFVLPFNIHNAASNGALNDKKKPAPYQKVRGNVFPDRARVTCERVICNCASDSGCGDNCINRIMSYLCGRDCPCGESCTNRSLAKRPSVETKVRYTGSRGFGLFAMQDIKEGDFVTDYRGEVISLNTFHERLVDEYAGQRNFYALAYDQDEVIDSGMKGNDARFINHGCDPNLVVRKYQQVGDGLQEYEVGMWASRDIKQGDELFYNYNFDWFAEAKDSLGAECRCGADKCIGVLGRRNGDKTAKELAVELAAKQASEAVKKVVKGRRGTMKKVVVKKMKKTGVTTKLGAAMQRAKISAAKANKSEAVEIEPEQEIVVVPEPSTSGAVSALEAAPICMAPVSPGRAHISEAVTYLESIDFEGEEEIDELDSDDVMDGLEIEGEDVIDADASANHEWEDIPDALPPNGAHASSQRGETHEPELTIARSDGDAAAAAMHSVPGAPPHTSRPTGQAVDSQPGAGLSSAQPRTSIFAATTPEFVPDPTKTAEQNAAAAKAAAAAAKRKSGWTNWLRKIAAEKDRTLEEWHEERIKRRRGIAWMNMMIAEFGVAPSPIPLTADAYSDGRKPAGSVASFANTLAAQGHGPGPQAVKNLGGPKNFYRSDNWSKTKEENMKYVGATPAPDSVRGTPGPSAARSASASAGPSGSRSGAGSHGTPGSARSPSASMSSGQGKRYRPAEVGNSVSSKRGKTTHGPAPVRIDWSAGQTGDLRMHADQYSHGGGGGNFSSGHGGPSRLNPSTFVSPLKGYDPMLPHSGDGLMRRRLSHLEQDIADSHLAGVDHFRTLAGSPPANVPRASTSQNGASQHNVPSEASTGWSQSRQSQERLPNRPAEPVPRLKMHAELMEDLAAEKGFRSYAELLQFEEDKRKRSMDAASQLQSHGELMREKEAEKAAAQPKPRSLGPFWKTAPTAAESRPTAAPAAAPAFPPAPASTTARPQSASPAVAPRKSFKLIAPAATVAPAQNATPTLIDEKPTQNQPSHTPTLVKTTEKKIAIAKRNGAPMGWAYEPVEPAPLSTAAVPEELGRGARRARQSLPAGV